MNDHTSKLGAEIAKAKKDIDKLSSEQTTLNYEFIEFRDKQIMEVLQQAAKLQLESMTAKIESKDFHDKIAMLLKDLKTLQSKVMDPAFLEAHAGGKVSEEDLKQ